MIQKQAKKHILLTSNKSKNKLKNLLGINEQFQKPSEAGKQLEIICKELEFQKFSLAKLTNLNAMNDLLKDYNSSEFHVPLIDAKELYFKSNMALETEQTTFSNYSFMKIGGDMKKFNQYTRNKNFSHYSTIKNASDFARLLSKATQFDFSYNIGTINYKFGTKNHTSSYPGQYISFVMMEQNKNLPKYFCSPETKEKYDYVIFKIVPKNYEIGKYIGDQGPFTFSELPKTKLTDIKIITEPSKKYEDRFKELINIKIGKVNEIKSYHLMLPPY